MAIEPESIRNVCLIGHRGSGKTALGEAMLGVASGRTGPQGNVLDFAEEEIERGMTLGMSVAQFKWKGRQINLLDTPGDGGFIADAFVAQRAADCAILVVHAQDPIQVVTERVWRRGEKEDIPHLVVVNHLDRERTDFATVVEQLRDRFGPAVVPLNLPVGREGDFKGVYGLVSGIAFVDGQQTNEVPAGMESEVEEAKVRLLETIAESDDTLLEKYLEGEELSTEEMFEGLRRGIADGVIIPVLAASAERIIGVDRVLDVIAGSAPSPADRCRWTTEDGEKVPCNEEGPFAAYVFKTYVDPYAGRLSVLRIVSGRCRSDETLTNPRTGSTERLGGISHLMGKERIPADEAVAGDIVAVAKLRDTHTFDTLCRPEVPIVFAPVELPEATTAFAVGAKTRGEEEKVFEAIKRVADEDPSLVLERSEDTGEDILSGLAQMHVEFAIERISRRYGVEVDARAPKVPFKETISGRAQAQGRYKKQTGGREGHHRGHERGRSGRLPGCGRKGEALRRRLPLGGFFRGGVQGGGLDGVQERFRAGPSGTARAIRQGGGPRALRARWRYYGRPLGPAGASNGHRAARRAAGHPRRGAAGPDAHLRPRPSLHHRRPRKLPR